MYKDRKILITGSDGLVGSALKSILTNGSHVFHTKKDVDLLDTEKTKDYFNYHIKHNGINTIIHCAAKVGGIQANMSNNKGFFIENFVMNNNVMTCAFQNEIPEFVNLLSTCIFPDENISLPLTIDQINNGPPHKSNHGYAYAKRISGIQIETINNVLKSNWISIVPTNIYGKHDNFNLDYGHIVPAMIHRSYLCKQNSQPLTIWGDGSPLRQLIYSDDLAKLILWTLDKWKIDTPFMAVNPKEHTIQEISEIICKKIGISSENLIYDQTKPKGQFKKTATTDAPLDFQFTSLEIGIEETVNWFIDNYPNLRK
jgi:GDP-L-fucose synthase